jgi:predicted flap endonuclease-1-like 5' DNA nuclease
MWDDFFRRWAYLLFWWVPRTEEPPPERAKESTTGASGQDVGRVPEEAVERQVPRSEEVVRDDLTVIKGIGPAVQDKLRSLGIVTFSDLAKADPKTLAKELRGSQPISEVRVRSWTEAARERTPARD